MSVPRADAYYPVSAAPKIIHIMRLEIHNMHLQDAYYGCCLNRFFAKCHQNVRFASDFAQPPTRLHVA